MLETSPKESKDKLNQNDFSEIMFEEISNFMTQMNESKSKILQQNEIRLQNLRKPRLRVPKNLPKNGFQIKAQIDPEVPRGIFVSPLPYNFSYRSEDRYSVEFIPYVKDFTKFTEIMESVKSYLDDWFYDYPRCKPVYEDINCKEFVIYMFAYYFKFHKESSSLNDMIGYLSQQCNKAPWVIYKVVSEFFSQPCFYRRRNNESTVLQYRTCHCNICDMYLCCVHFYKDLSKNDNIKELKLEGKEDFVFEKVITKTSLQVECRNIFPGRWDRFKQPDSKCKECISRGSGSNSYANKDVNLLLAEIERKDLYCLCVFLDTEESFLKSPCFWNINKMLSKN
jgi:hypothetical protein